MAFLLSCFLLDQVHGNASFLGSCKDKNQQDFYGAYKGPKPSHLNDGHYTACETNFVLHGKTIALKCALTQAVATAVGVYSGVTDIEYIFKCLPCKDKELMRKYKILSKYEEFMPHEDNCLDHITVATDLNSLYHLSDDQQPQLRADHADISKNNLGSIYISGTAGPDGINKSLAVADSAILQESSSLQQPVNDKATVELSNYKEGVEATMTLKFRTYGASEFTVKMTDFQVTENAMALGDYAMTAVHSAGNTVLTIKRITKAKIKTTEMMVGEIAVKIAGVVNPRAAGKTKPFDLTVTEGRSARTLIASGVNIEAQLVKVTVKFYHPKGETYIVQIPKGAKEVKAEVAGVDGGDPQGEVDIKYATDGDSLKEVEKHHFLSSRA